MELKRRVMKTASKTYELCITVVVINKFSIMKQLIQCLHTVPHRTVLEYLVLHLFKSILVDRIY